MTRHSAVRCPWALGYLPIRLASVHHAFGRENPGGDSGRWEFRVISKV